MAELSVLSATKTKSNLKINSLSDLKKLDINEVLAIDPEKLNLGTGLQDAALIARMYERGAHYTPTEAAVMAPLQRGISNQKILSHKLSKVVDSYLQGPQDSASEQVSQLLDSASSSSEGEGVSVESGSGASDGTKGVTDQLLTNMKVGDEDVTTKGEDFGDKMLGWAKDCIPCLERPDSWVQMQPNLNLLDSLEASIGAGLDNLMRIGELLKNFDIFGDLCAFLDLLDFVCIPDLQRILAALMAFLQFEIPSFEGLLNFIQALIAPFFAPILGGLAGLLDQFVLLVSNPLTCIIDAINAQLAKLKFDKTGPSGTGVESTQPLSPGVQQPNVRTGAPQATQQQQRPIAWAAEKLDQGAQYAQDIVDQVDEFNEGLNDSFRLLTQILTNVKNKIQERLNMILDEFKALIGEFTLQDTAYMLKAASKLSIVRIISFILAIINAKKKGSAICSGQGVPAEKQEINTFFNNFLNPNGAFNLWIDDSGRLHVDEKYDLPNVENVFEFEGDELIPDKAEEIRASLVEPVRVLSPCRLEVTASNVDTVNRYITELNEA